MHLSALRTAAIAGSCAVALSFIALPAHAVTVSSFRHSGSDSSSSESSGTESSSPSAGTANASTDDSGSTAGDDGTAASDGTPQAGDDDATEAGDDDATTDDDGTDASDDQGDDASGTTTAPVVLAAEQGTPTQSFRQTVLLPKEIRTRGIKVVYSGLTRKADYQPYFSNGQSGGPIGEVRKANGKGVITLTIHPRKDLAWMTTLGSSFVIGLRGVDTDLDLTQPIEVKYDSDVALTTKRHGKRVALTVSVDHETKSGEDAAWKQVKVRFQKKVGTKWVTVRTARTDAKGHARTKVAAGRSEWRAVVASGATVAGTTTRSHRR